MSNYTASNLDEQVQEITEFINAEADGAARGVRTQLVVLAVVCLILVGYFFFLKTWVDDHTQPQFVAQQAAITLDDNIPDIAGQIEMIMNDVTPEVADFVANKAVAEGVPFLVRRSEEFLDTYIEQMTAGTAHLMDQAFNEVVSENRMAIRESIEQGQSGDDPSQSLSSLRDRLHAAFTDQTTGKRTEAGLAVDHSLTALVNLNKRLKELASKDPKKMDRREKMGARLLQTYWRYIRATPVDVVGEDAPVETPGVEHKDE